MTNEITLPELKLLLEYLQNHQTQVSKKFSWYKEEAKQEVRDELEVINTKIRSVKSDIALRILFLSDIIVHI